jgi:hypothetical protein
MNRILTVLLLAGSLAVGATPPKTDLRAHLQPTVFALTRVMMHDVVNPPAASRFYSYCLLGAHELVARGNARVVAPRRLLRVTPEFDVPGPGTNDYPVAALYCILETGRLLLPSGELLAEDQRKLTAQLRREGYPEARLQRAVAVAKTMAQGVLAYAATDGYRNLSARLRYRPTRRDGYWYPTPPGYIEAVEPHWKTIRPMLIDSCGQFVPPPPVAFGTDSASAFGELTREVYRTGQRLTPEQRLIASYWDCNPFALNTAGHMAIGFKKISPGGHWLNIASQATEQAQLPFDEAVVVQSITALTLMDAFISCWDEKYRSNRVRPETVINRYLDARWQPLLQTPPFPEYPSGHSVISTAAAEVLTYLLGENFAFTDTTEEWFELPSRRFTSFRQAAAEASISRLYGGIHFRDAIERGQRQGGALGTFVVARLRAAGVGPSGVRPSGPGGSGRE